jgi:hypothetical protein
MTGALLGGAAAIASNAANELAPAVAFGSVGDRYLVAWERSGDVYARVYWP